MSWTHRHPLLNLSISISFYFTQRNLLSLEMEWPIKVQVLGINQQPLCSQSPLSHSKTYETPTFCQHTYVLTNRTSSTESPVSESGVWRVSDSVPSFVSHTRVLRLDPEYSSLMSTLFKTEFTFYLKSSPLRQVSTLSDETFRTESSTRYSSIVEWKMS